jgi:hypothetical protein
MLQTQSRLFTPESFTRVTWLVSLLEQELLTLSGALQKELGDTKAYFDAVNR